MTLKQAKDRLEEELLSAKIRVDTEVPYALRPHPGPQALSPAP